MIISASTAAGKTEAAFLPILTAVAGQRGVTVLAVSPLKALINDQYDRLLDLAEAVDVPVHRWHGDVPQSEKARFRKSPAGVLLITPESLEAALMRRPTETRRWLCELRCVVIDEFHAFIGTERGVQLLSQLSRIDANSERAPRVALSATLGDIRLAAAALRPSAPDEVVTVVARSSGELRLGVRGYLDPLNHTEPSAVSQVADSLYADLRGGKHLAFCNSRSMVEQLTDALVGRCERAHVPIEFTPHHGSLSRGIREHAEAQLKRPATPATVVCTSTLELGIDVGHVESIAQVGVPTSVSALRQRLGRSGRAGTPSILRVHIMDGDVGVDAHIEERLRIGMVQTIACIRLLVSGWFEPPATAALHTSTLVQQMLSSLVEHGGMDASHLWKVIDSPDSPFDLDLARFKSLLRSLSTRRIIEQAPDGTLLLADVGERIAHHYSFYAAFNSPDEYRLACAGRTLGTLPVDFPLSVDDTVIYAGRRWRVTTVDEAASVVEVIAHSGGHVPRFISDAGAVHARIVEEMRTVYEDAAVYGWLDETAQSMLIEGRSEYERLGMATKTIVEIDEGLLIAPWLGSVGLQTLHLLLRANGLGSFLGEHVLIVTEADEAELAQILAVVRSAPPSADQLAQNVENRRVSKHDWMLDDALSAANYASEHLNVDAAIGSIDRLLGGLLSR